MVKLTIYNPLHQLPPRRALVVTRCDQPKPTPLFVPGLTNTMAQQRSMVSSECAGVSLAGGALAADMALSRCGPPPSSVHSGFLPLIPGPPLMRCCSNGCRRMARWHKTQGRSAYQQLQYLPCRQL